MAINTALLICAPILQDYFSDNATDAAMSNGVITCFQDNSRTTLKNWYYQSGSPGAYTYTQLPNPLVLSAAGTITDANGNDTIPFWYPYSEADNTTFQPYYVTVDNSNGQRQFTRQNFPFIANPGSTNSFLSTLTNLVTNNVFWRNAGSLTLTNTLNAVVAPSQHDGFVSNMSDMVFIKDATGATDTVTFTQFTNATTFPASTNDGNPEFYMNVACGNSGSSETTKYIQIPICLHVANLSGYTNASVTLWTQNVAGSPNNTIRLNLFQFLGTGVSSPVATTIGTINPSDNTWIRTTFTFSFPLATIPAGGPGDDAWFLQIAFPVGVQFNMNIAKPSIYLSNVVPIDDFQTYEVVSGTIDSPRTGDIRTSLNAFYPFGWVVMNDGTIGNASSNASARANSDAWPLFNLIWSMFSQYVNGTTNFIAQMLTSAGANVAYGSSAIADWNANRQISLTKTLGRVLTGTLPPGFLGYPQNVWSQNVSGSADGGGNLLLNVPDTSVFYKGQPITFSTKSSLPGNLLLTNVYYVSDIASGTTMYVSTTFSNAINSVYIAYSSAGSMSTVYGSIAGTNAGEHLHTQLISELAAHTHHYDRYQVQGGGAQLLGGATYDPNYPSVATTSTGSSTPFNIMQLYTAMNFYMKL